MDRNISFTEDIVEEVAKELGLSEDAVYGVYVNSVKYVRDHMEDPDCCAVTLPYLGTMHINKGSLYSSIKTQERALEKGKSIDEEKYAKNKHRMELILDLEKRRSEEGLGEPNKHSKRTILRMLKRKTGKSLLEIEQIQKDKNG